MSNYSDDINPQPSPGSLFDNLHDAPPPVTPTRFEPFSSHVTQRRETPATDDRFPCVTFQHYTPRVCGIQQDNTTVKLMDSGSNIILTNDISLLRELQDITPFAISVALNGESTLDDYCTKQGLLTLTRDDGRHFDVTCYYCPNATETIISPQAIITESPIFTKWTQVGYKDPAMPGKVQFSNINDTVTMTISLTCNNGFYYCHSDRYRRPAEHPTVLRTATGPITRAQQLESELWLLRLGSPAETQLSLLPNNSTGMPKDLHSHPFRYADFKEQAYIRKQPANKSAERLEECGSEFFMDFGFMRASTEDYKRPNKLTDRVILSYDGYSSYLLIVDGASRRVWAFLTKTKQPPIHLIRAFMKKFGNSGGIVRTDQGGELARSSEFKTVLESEFGYIVEPTGADSPSQNGGSEIYNDKLAVKTRTLLYQSNLPPKFWSSALIHSVYLHNRLVHSVTKTTPYQAWYGKPPDLSNLRVFGSRVCVKRPGPRRCKLDRADYSGIFLGYTATDKNIIYLDTESGVVKSSHHATFDESWYLQPKRPPAAQLLYDLGLEQESSSPATSPDPPTTTSTGLQCPAPWPPCAIPTPGIDKWYTPPKPRSLPLPLQEFDSNIRTAAAATVNSFPRPSPKPLTNKQTAADLVTHYLIGAHDMATIYMSPDPYHNSFTEVLNLRKFDPIKHRTAGLCFIEKDSRVLLATMSPNTPGSRIPRWRTNLRGAWLISVNNKPVQSIADVQHALQTSIDNDDKECSLLFAHPEGIFHRDISHDGLPIMSSTDFDQLCLDQLNNRKDILLQHPARKRQYDIVDSGKVLNYTARAMKLTRGRLLKQDDWDEWKQSEYLQLDQYDEQGMFGAPIAPKSDDPIFYLVWTYTIKQVDNRKKARCVCDGSTRSGQVQVLDETYANCVDHTSARLFYAVAAGENLKIYGADVSNAFAEAPPPKQGFYIKPDKAFHEWWTIHKKRPPIPPGHVIPVNSAMQGHPESPRLWEKHADSILRQIGLTPTAHEPCLYSGIIDGHRVIFMRQVDDFAIATTDEATANKLLDTIDDMLSIPLKRQGLLDMFNGIDIVQTKHYVKIDCHTYINKFCEKYIDTWLGNMPITENKPTPLPSSPTWVKSFNAATGSNDPKIQQQLAKEMQINYRTGVGEIIWAMTTCRPDIAFTSVKLSQSNSAPHQLHYHGLKHTIKYLYATRDDGIYYWRTKPCDDLKEGSPPKINSALHDLLLDKRPDHQPQVAVAYADSDWATCTKTRRSFTGVCIFLSGGVIAYKTRFQPTVALSSTEAEFMAACDVGRMCLFIRSILWDLDIPQEAATVAYEDNDGCTAMGNAQKPTSRTRHIDIKYFALCEWIERDYIHLERIDTSVNMADHLTKTLSRILFHRHADFLMGHIPPRYSAAYDITVSTIQHNDDIDNYVPTSFTTPATAKASRILRPIKLDITGNPWLPVLWWNESYNSHFLDSMNCGGVLDILDN